MTFILNPEERGKVQREGELRGPAMGGEGPGNPGGIPPAAAKRGPGLEQVAQEATCESLSDILSSDSEGLRESLCPFQDAAPALLSLGHLCVSSL